MQVFLSREALNSYITQLCCQVNIFILIFMSKYRCSYCNWWVIIILDPWDNQTKSWFQLFESNKSKILLLQVYTCLMIWREQRQRQTSMRENISHICIYFFTLWLLHNQHIRFSTLYSLFTSLETCENIMNGGILFLTSKN